MAVLTACQAPSLPGLKRNKPSQETKTITAAAPANATATPRELLTARLVNETPDDATPPITVGKLIEFADRYLACDCSDKRFVRSWERTADGYRLYTNSDLVAPLNFVCSSASETSQCFLGEIDRGKQVADLSDRFVPGGDFIEFMYQNGLQCERSEPCP